ncbi:cupin 2 domain-containing protein [Nostoc commune NIES-4072]|uniref:Cupin 2 domain-containing protein n=1 Tax=Nostoc commune NIES-4072 TaxID=2005467 RepID=A0A2R5G2X4_NOSCO|nr:cupin 2 domain-containing protein [Nostoc commune HK-02]GBG22421.1 cupin 2 domain-containing protein [Nostoc commune NIES-4072]
MEKYLVTKEEIESYEGLEKTHFLNSNARRLNKSFPAIRVRKFAE